MPVLENSRHEAFAYLRAQGERLEDAYEDAGFASGHGHASRLARRPEVAARIVELQNGAAHVYESAPHVLIEHLLRLVNAGYCIGTPASLKESRLALLDIARLRAEQRKQRQAERQTWREGKPKRAKSTD